MADSDDLLKEARQIWGNRKLPLSEIIIALGVVYGDICRWERDSKLGLKPKEQELKKELGNIILSTVRWIDDLGFDYQVCLDLAKTSQTKFRETWANRQ